MSIDYKSISQILEKIIQKQNLQDEIEKSILIDEFENIVGSQIAKQVKIKNLKDGILTVEIESSPWKSEIFLMREKIIEKINNTFGRQIVKQIRIL